MPEHRMFCDKQAQKFEVISNKSPKTDRLIWCSYWVKWTVTFSMFSVYKFWDFCSGVPEGSTILGYGAASMDNRILTFWGKAKSSSSRFKMYSWAYQPLKMRIPCCLHMFGSSYPLMHLNIPEEKNWISLLPHNVFTDGAQFTHDGIKKKFNYLMGAAKSTCRSTI